MRMGLGMQRQPEKPQPMQQYTLFPITNPFTDAQRDFFNLHVGQVDMRHFIIFWSIAFDLFNLSYCYRQVEVVASPRRVVVPTSKARFPDS